MSTDNSLKNCRQTRYFFQGSIGRTAQDAYLATDARSMVKFLQEAMTYPALFRNDALNIALSIYTLRSCPALSCIGQVFPLLQQFSRRSYQSLSNPDHLTPPAYLRRLRMQEKGSPYYLKHRERHDCRALSKSTCSRSLYAGVTPPLYYTEIGWQLVFSRQELASPTNDVVAPDGRGDPPAVATCCASSMGHCDFCPDVSPLGHHE